MMGQQIIKQPDGLYCIWSSIVDDVIWYDCTRQDIVDIRIAEAKKRINREVDEVLTKIEAGEQPYYQFTMTWKDVKKFVDKDRRKQVKAAKGQQAKDTTANSKETQ